MANTTMIDQILDGRYRITQVLATGGFGQTYLAVDMRRPGQPVCVVKQLRSVENPALVPTVQRLFKTEAATLEKLGRHDCIPRLLAYFEENQEFYLVQEFIPGQALDRELLPEHPLAIAQVISLLIDVLEILVFVHAQGVIHRDIKPANIIRREPDQKLVLIDFGTVKEIRTLTEGGKPKLTMAVGTPAYMPAEQFHGYPQLNSDIYALGVVGIQAMSGLSIDEIRTLITSNHPPTDINHWSGAVPVIEAAAAENDQQQRQLVDILDKMVALDYRKRYQSATSVLDALEAVQSESPTSSPKVIPSYISPLSSELPSQLPDQPLEYDSVESEPLPKPKSRQLAGKLLAGSGVAIALMVGAYRLTSSISPPSPPATPPPVQSTSPANAHLALVRTLAGHTDAVWSVALSQDGQLLASGSQDGTIKVWNPTTGELFGTIQAEAGPVLSVNITADRRTLVAGSGDGTIKVWDLTNGELRYTLTGHRSSVWSVALSDDGKTLVSGSDDNNINVWNLETGELVRTLTGHSRTVYSVALSPYGKTIMSASADRTIRVWDIETGQLLRTLEGHGSTVRSLAMSPDGQTLASGSWDRTIKIWNIQSGELLKTFEGHRDRVVSVAFSADGATLASASIDGTVKVWDAQTGTTLQTLSDHTDWVLSVASSTQTQTLVSGSRDKTIKVWQR